MHKYILGFLLLAWLPALRAQDKILLRGALVETDSVTAMPFVYVINQNSGEGLMSDFSGKFVIPASLKDTVMFSFVGYLKVKLPVAKLYKPDGSECKVVMKQIAYALNQIVVSDFKLKPYEKDYMKRVIDHSKMPTINAISSPITALYMQFSRKGREQRKLAAIFEEIFEKEEVAKKFNPEVLRKLTGDDTIDFEAFRKYCFYLSNDFILNHDGYDLYYRVMDCYYRWKQERR